LNEELAFRFSAQAYVHRANLEVYRETEVISDEKEFPKCAFIKDWSKQLKSRRPHSAWVWQRGLLVVYAP